MKRNLAAIAILLVSITSMAADKSAASPFEQLKALTGVWEAKGPDGKIHTDTWSLIANATVMMDSMQPENVVTMYYLDGARLMITHYCMLKNQPRMVAEISPHGKKLSFNFLDITNLSSPEAKHMHRMVMTLEDATHYSQEWFVLDAGKERTGALHYTRKP